MCILENHKRTDIVCQRKKRIKDDDGEGGDKYQKLGGCSLLHYLRNLTNKM